MFRDYRQVQDKKGGIKTINEMTMLKANIMGGMNEYIKEQGDDDLWNIWIEVFPDECSEDELMEIAENDSIWLDIVNRFAYCCKTIGVIE